MSKSISLVTVLALSVGFSSFAIANTSRDERINQALDCIDAQQQLNPAVNWNDVCYIADNPVSALQSKLIVVNQQLDQLSQSPSTPLQPSAPVSSNSVLPFEKDQGDDGDWAAFDDDNVKPADSTIVSKKNELTLGYEMYVAKYEEPSLMHQEGDMAGISGQYTYRPTEQDDLYFKFLDVYRLQGQWASGSFDYSSNGTGTLNGQDNMSFDIRGLIGKDYYPAKSIRTTPYIGLGYRFLLDEGENMRTSTGHLAYDRESRYFYIPIGMDVMYQLKPTYSLNFNAEVDYVAQGKQVSKLSYLGIDDATNIQNSGFGLRSSLKLTKTFDKLNLFGEAFFRYWNISRSDVAFITEDVAVIEPYNNTREIGLRLGVEL